jgi:hypothetical protein
MSAGGGLRAETGALGGLVGDSGVATVDDEGSLDSATGFRGEAADRVCRPPFALRGRERANRSRAIGDKKVRGACRTRHGRVAVGRSPATGKGVDEAGDRTEAALEDMELSESIGE